jgi:hypothetical protein
MCCIKVILFCLYSYAFILHIGATPVSISTAISARHAVANISIRDPLGHHLHARGGAKYSHEFGAVPLREEATYQGASEGALDQLRPVQCRNNLSKSRCEANCHCTTSHEVECTRPTVGETHLFDSQRKPGELTTVHAENIRKDCEPQCGCEDEDGFILVEGKEIPKVEWAAQGPSRESAPDRGHIISASSAVEEQSISAVQQHNPSTSAQENLPDKLESAADQGHITPSISTQTPEHSLSRRDNKRTLRDDSPGKQPPTTDANMPLSTLLESLR